MRLAFIVNDLQLSGGVGVVVQHARRLSMLTGWEVTLVLAREPEGPSWHGYEHLPDLHVRTRAEALAQSFDIAIATWWETTFTLFELRARRYAYFVQSLEERFYPDGQAGRLGAALTVDLPVAFITEARWIADTLAALRPDARCYLVRNGIDKQVFRPLERVVPSFEEPLRVLVEGSPSVWHKRVPEAMEAVARMTEPHRLTVVSGERESLRRVEGASVVGPLTHREMSELYCDHDVLVKLSSVEGMFGPPLEGFHRGATCVVTPVTGYDEYVEHGYNGLLTDWEDLGGTARALDLLARDRRLLHHLRCNALETARGWPSWDQSSQFMAAALLQIQRDPEPSAAAAAVRLTADLRGHLEGYQRVVSDRDDYARRALRFERRISWAIANPVVRRFLALRRLRAVRLAARPLIPVVRRLRRIGAQSS